MVLRVYVEKKPGFDIEARQLLAELRDIVGVKTLEGLRLINRYDVEGISRELFSQCVTCVFSEPQSDNVSFDLPGITVEQDIGFDQHSEDVQDARSAQDNQTAQDARSAQDAQNNQDVQDAQVNQNVRADQDAQNNQDVQADQDAQRVRLFAVEYLPGQFDQRADSASECIQLISQGERPLVRSAKLYYLEGELSEADVQAVKHYVINPIEAREASLETRQTLAMDYPDPADVETVEGFVDLDEAGLAEFIAARGLAMDEADIALCQQYFADEGRNPTITEIKMIDTYWSDHCRHTTFATQLDDIEIVDANVQDAFDSYIEMRHELGRDEKPLCLMDMGTLAARWLKAHGQLGNLDESEEINACTVRCKVDVDGEEQDWLYLFKNETHNHPTEIEPFGGAATCIGGAIRDPLSGRGYVYQAMRVTGAADPRIPVADTLPGKLPQRKIVTTAAQGYSSYGNQIGLATGQVYEWYHPGYAAKRMEIGVVVGATPADHVYREKPTPGDVVILLGGRTGRDGIGGATGSSKAHSMDSLETCGAEVQKGNAPVERKIQRLFRHGDVCRMIKRCNDFGAGGVSVAVGELADSLLIDLDSVPKKYDGLDGTELALSESQERMAVMLSADDVEAFLALAHEENLEATPIATVTDDGRVRMTWRGKTIVDISRNFLASNGASKSQTVYVEAPRAYIPVWQDGTINDRLRTVVTDINVASNKGLSERFDSTIGAATVLMPFGGAYQLTAPMAMVAKLPVEGETTTVSGMAWGFNPYLSEADPFAGSYLAVVESIAKLVATGFKRSDIYLTFQEYFERLRDDPARWGKPVAALLGALKAQTDLSVASIGGKDSMSGSFEDLDVPPTLVSFATALGSVDRITSPEFKGEGHRVILISAHGEQKTQAAHDTQNADESKAPDAQSTLDGGVVASLMPNATGELAVLALMEELIGRGAVLAASTPGYGGVAEALFKMCVGNHIGITCWKQIQSDMLFSLAYGSFIVELAEGVDIDSLIDELFTSEQRASFTVEPFGLTTEVYELFCDGEVVPLDEMQEAWESSMEGVFPYRTSEKELAEFEPIELVRFPYIIPGIVHKLGSRPRVVIPVFPGNNCEYDSARAFEQAGAVVNTFVINNLTPNAVVESTAELVRLINNAQIIMLPGGFSGGDEPDGSAKFIAAFFRAPQVTEAVRDLLQNRDGLMLGICNGFQALVKLGLVPFGDIFPMDASCPTLTFNRIGRHQSRLVRTRISSTLSPWFSGMNLGEIHTVAISHGEGRFVASESLLAQLADDGQIATQYVGMDDLPSMDLSVNPNGSIWAIEGITSPDGRILGKMGHSERGGSDLYKNVPDILNQPIFEAGVSYFD